MRTTWKLSSNKTKLTFLLSLTFLFLFLWANPSFAESAKLPFDLNYFMTKKNVLNHTKMLKSFKTNTGHKNEIAYLIPVPSDNTVNGIFLKFQKDKLVQIDSVKAKMSTVLYKKYFKRMLLITDQWKSAGAITVMENAKQNIYLYKFMGSYISVSSGGSPNDHTVTISYSEIGYHEQKYKGLKR
tara:strand:+ start:81 stop:632 length:552 start_codon:yes stop_codon:yes gene_type:complete